MFMAVQLILCKLKLVVTTKCIKAEDQIKCSVSVYEPVMKHCTIAKTEMAMLGGAYFLNYCQGCR